jgi:hypothetical protein
LSWAKENFGLHTEFQNEGMKLTSDVNVFHHHPRVLKHKSGEVGGRDHYERVKGEISDWKLNSTLKCTTTKAAISIIYI